MKTYLSIALIILLFKPAQAQHVDAPSFDKNSTFSGYVYGELYKRSKHLIGVCSKVLGSIQITLNRNGNIKNITITGDMPDLLRQQLKEIVLNSDKLWTPMKINGKPTNSIPIVMLINIHIADGCESMYNDVYYLNEKRFDFYKSLNSSLSGTKLPMKCFLIQPLLYVSDYSCHFF